MNVQTVNLILSAGLVFMSIFTVILMSFRHSVIINMNKTNHNHAKEFDDDEEDE